MPFVKNPPLGKWYQRKASHLLPKRPTVNPLNKLKPNNLSTKVSAFWKINPRNLFLVNVFFNFHQSNAVGIWTPIPKKNSLKKLSKFSKVRPTKWTRNSQKKTQQWLIPRTRHRQKRPHRKFSSNMPTIKPKIRRPIFKVSLVPNSILGKLYGMKPKDFLSKIPKLLNLNKPIHRLFDTDNSIFSCISSITRFQFDSNQVLNEKELHARLFRHLFLICYWWIFYVFQPGCLAFVAVILVIAKIVMEPEINSALFNKKKYKKGKLFSK